MKLSEEFIIRPATNSDSGRIKRLVFGILEEYGLKSDTSSTDKDLDDIEYYYTNNDGYFAVITNAENLIIASTGLFKINKTTCELRKMYLSKRFRGKGLGRFLLEFSLDKAKELGYSQVVLETASVLKEAIGLYKSYGFSEETGGHLSSRCDQRYFLKL